MKIWLHQYINFTIRDHFSIKREIELPFVPSVGTTLSNCQERSESSDPSEDTIREIVIDLKDNSIHCYLENYDGIDWSREELINYYKNNWMIENNES